MLLLVDLQVEQRLNTQLALQSCITNLLEADPASHVQATTVCLYNIRNCMFKLMLIALQD
jgi:hypothetical protein